MQSSRSKLTTCPRKGPLLSFQRNSTATSFCGTQKLGNNLWYDPESIATKVCSQNSSKWKAKSQSHLETCIDWTIATKVCRQNSSKWKAMSPSHVETCIDWTIFNFLFQDFLSKLLLKIVIFYVTYQTSIPWSWRSVQVSGAQFSLFWGQWPAQWAWCKKCAKRKYFAVYPSRVEDDCGLCVEWFNWVLKICPKFQVLVFSHFWSWLSAWYKKCAKKKYFNSKKSPIYVKCDKRFAIKNSGVLVWPWYLTWTIWEWNC